MKSGWRKGKNIHIFHNHFKELKENSADRPHSFGMDEPTDFA